MGLLNFIRQEKTVFLDGGMGTELARIGLGLNSGLYNLSHPEKVSSVHQSYVDSGAQVLVTNTFTMNPIYLKTHKLDIDLTQVNQEGVKIAKEAGGAYVLGDMGPTGQLMQPFGPYGEEEVVACYRTQGEILAASGVDGFLIETMLDLNEAICALKACKAVADLPVLVSLTISTKSDGGRTLMGQTMAQCAREVKEAGGDVIGANCGELDPLEMAELVAALKEETDLPILAKPNAGKPKLVKGKTVYDMTPEVFAQGILQCIKGGASLVGGCCGTTPEHIREITRVYKSQDK